MENSKPSQKGEMSRLALELKSGVFVADIGARIREKLWRKIVEDWKLNAIMLYSTNAEQSFKILVNGDPSRTAVDFDGITLLSKPVDK